MTPKTEIRLFRIGANDTEKGTFYVTPEDAKAILAAWKARGTDLSWDYDHDVVAEGAQGPRMASGWSQLEVRKDGVWATAIRWTKRALGLIDAEEYRYFSPFFEHTEDGHVTNIVNVALTNIPATHGIDAVAASAKPHRRASDRIVRGKLQEIPRGTTTRRATDTTARASALGKTIMTKEEMMKALAAINEQCQALAAALDEMPDDAVAAAADPDEKEKVAASAEPEGDKAEATSVAAALCAFTGLKSPLKALAKVLSAGGGAAGGEDQEQADKVALIEQGIASGKLQPSLKPWASTLSAASLRKYLGSAKPVVKTAETKEAASKTGASSTTLSATEQKVCKDMGISHEAFVAQRAKLSGAGGVKLYGPHHRAQDAGAERHQRHCQAAPHCRQGGGQDLQRRSRRSRCDRLPRSVHRGHRPRCRRRRPGDGGQHHRRQR